MVSLDLKDAYLQVPMQPDSRKFLRFMVGGRCTSSRYFASAFPRLHRFLPGHGSCVSDSTQDGGTTSSLPGRLVASGILTRAGSSCSEDSAPTLQTPRDCCQLGAVSGDSDSADGISGSHPGLTAFRAAPALKRVEKLLSIGDVFLSCVSQPVSSWLELLGVLSSMIQLVPGGLFRMRSLQLILRHQWDQIDQSQLVEWSPVIQDYLSWWRDRNRLVLSVSLEQVSPQLELWSDASDVGWGGSLGRAVRFRPVGSGRRRALDQCMGALGDRECSQVVCSTSRRFLSGGLRRQSTAVSYLRNQGGTRSSFLNSIAQRILRWAEDLSVVISPQFIMGKHNVLADTLSRPKQILGSEWTLKQEVFRDLCRRWPVSIGLFATSQITDVPYIFLLATITMIWGRMRFFETGVGGRRMLFLPWSLIPAGLKKLRSSSGVLLTIVAPYWPQRPWFPDLLDLVVDGPVALPQSRDLLRQPHFHRFHLGVSRLSSCLVAIKRFTRAGGFSRRVAQQVSLARRPSSRAGYQSKWLVFRQWCRSEGHSISHPSFPKIADFLFWLRRYRRLSVSSVMGYRSMLSAVFKSVLPEISISPVLHVLLRSFRQRRQFGRFVLLPGI